MSVDKTCKTCMWWRKPRPKGDTGECRLVGAESLPAASGFDVEVTVDDDHNLDWELKTGQDFGCVHHTPKPEVAS